MFLTLSFLHELYTSSVTSEMYQILKHCFLKHQFSTAVCFAIFFIFCFFRSSPNFQLVVLRHLQSPGKHFYCNPACVALLASQVIFCVQRFFLCVLGPYQRHSDDSVVTVRLNAVLIVILLLDRWPQISLLISRSLDYFCCMPT